MLTSHLNEVGETYFQHFGHAFGFAMTMALGAVVCLIHAVFPFLFERTGSNFIRHLHDRMVVNRMNLTRNKTYARTDDSAIPAPERS
ncbi:MAG: DUF6356 family protein [Arenicellales bacterium]